MPQKMYMQTTAIPAMQTAGEIISLLVQSGAREISQTYDGKMKLTGVRFTLEVAPGMIRLFSLPVRIEPVFKCINGARKYNWDRTESAAKDREQAERVAWRQLYRWCQAQLAMIQTGMVEAGEVFLPYMEHESGQTLFELVKSNSQKLLGVGVLTEKG